MGGWWPKPRFYDVINGAFDKPEDVYVPFGWGPALQQLPVGMVACWGDESRNTYAAFLGSECNWIQMWVELPNAASRDRMLALMNAYAVSQRHSGRFQRPLNNRLTRVGEWLAQQGVVTDDSRLLLRLAFAFLAVSLINTAGILLAKFLRAAPTAGVRRALGATRAQIFLQHLIEVAALALAGSALGLALGALGLRAMHWLYAINTVDNAGYQELTHFDPAGVTWALALAFLSTFAAGLYPAWRIGRMPPASYLKSQ
jgi:putative ABC transport system permease protein